MRLHSNNWKNNEKSGSIGIDVESLYSIFSSSSFPYPTIVAKVNNEEDLHASLDVMAKEGICQPIAEEEVTVSHPCQQQSIGL